MKPIFKLAPFYGRSFFQKLFQQYPDENAVIALNNLLASKSIKAISLQEVSKIVSKYKVNIYKVYKRNLLEFYAVYLNHTLITNSFTKRETQQELAHLKEILQLNDKDVENIQNKVSGSFFQTRVKQSIANGRLDEEKNSYLDRLQKELRLTDSFAESLSIQVRGNFINNYLKEILTKERLSPEDEDELEAMTKSLRLKVKFSNETKAKLERCKLYWSIENDRLLIKEVDINLQKGEKCFSMAAIGWYEQKPITKRSAYPEPVRIKINKGEYYRSGSRQRVAQEEWKLVDSGTVYLTNKRLIFVGFKKNSSVRLDKILSFIPYSDGIEIHKETGKNPLLYFTDNLDVFGILLARLIREANTGTKV